MNYQQAALVVVFHSLLAVWASFTCFCQGVNNGKFQFSVLWQGVKVVDSIFLIVYYIDLFKFENSREAKCVNNMKKRKKYQNRAFEIKIVCFFRIFS